MGTKHDEVAKHIAKKLGVDYNRGKGADVKSRKTAVEVETENTINDAKRQLQGHRKPVYVAGTTKKAVEKAKKAMKGTTIGVMDADGKIVKRSTRKGK